MAVVAGLAIPGSVAAQPGAHVPQPTAVGTGGAAATVDSLATGAAIETLEDGGNAVDAAVAAAAVLGVVEPFSCGIGGGGFMVIYNAGDGSVTTIDGRETAPAAMRPDSFFENGVPLAVPNARWSGLSAGVPGTVRTWDEALDRYGTISLAEAVAPAVDVAREGFLVDPVFFGQVQGNVDFFDDISSTKALYLDPDGTPRTSERSSGTPISRARTSASPTSARRASTAARSRTRWSRQCRTRRSRPTRTTSGGQA